MSVEANVSHEIPENNPFSQLENKVSHNIENGKDLLIEGIPQMEAICERNPVAMEMFCASPQGF